MYFSAVLCTSWVHATSTTCFVCINPGSHEILHILSTYSLFEFKKFIHASLPLRLNRKIILPCRGLNSDGWIRRLMCYQLSHPCLLTSFNFISNRCNVVWSTCHISLTKNQLLKAHPRLYFIVRKIYFCFLYTPHPDFYSVQFNNLFILKLPHTVYITNLRLDWLIT